MKFSQALKTSQVVDGSGIGRRRTYKSKEERNYYIDLFERSHMTQAAFCKKHNLHTKTLSRWLSTEQTTKQNATQAETYKAKRHQLMPAKQFFEIKFPNGITATFTNVAADELIFSILQEVAKCRFN